jgi:hypothetical protein
MTEVEGEGGKPDENDELGSASDTESSLDLVDNLRNRSDHWNLALTPSQPVGQQQLDTSSEGSRQTIYFLQSYCC